MCIFVTQILQISFPCMFVVSPTTKREHPGNNNCRVFEVFMKIYKITVYNE